MYSLNIDLGNGFDYLAPLYSVPSSSSNGLLETVIAEWFQKTLNCDGYSDLSASALVSSSSGSITIVGTNGQELPQSVEGYASVMPQFLEIGNEALQTVVPQLHSDGKWDPQNTGKWHFFLPHGLPMLNFLSVQFFHYPPLRLLESKSYLHDPVPYRWGQLLQVAGATEESVDLYQRYIDAVPIAAPDDQGAYMPVSSFADYQRQMTELFLGVSTAGPTPPTKTVPVVVFGIPAMAQFEHLFFANLDVLVPQQITIVDGIPTPCLGSTHPYHFYAQAQIDIGEGLTIGDGKMGRGCQLAQLLMQQDMIAAYWQVGMAADRNAGVGDMLFQATTAALTTEKAHTVCALTAHQGSLYYPDPNQLSEFTFKLDYSAAWQQCEQNMNPCCC